MFYSVSQIIYSKFPGFKLNSLKIEDLKEAPELTEKLDFETLEIVNAKYSKIVNYLLNQIIIQSISKSLGVELEALTDMTMIYVVMMVAVLLTLNKNAQGVLELIYQFEQMNPFERKQTITKDTTTMGHSMPYNKEGDTGYPKSKTTSGGTDEITDTSLFHYNTKLTKFYNLKNRIISNTINECFTRPTKTGYFFN